MCGIAGIVRVAPAPAPEREALLRMAAALQHRGPDEFGLYRDQRAGLAHTRLSIVDLTSGQQPLCNETGKLWVSFNGEIFNYVELRAELIELGHVFRTKSDTEVIVHAYEAWGDEAFARMSGQWAIALWDSEKEELVLSRDRLGIRPLYIAEHRGSIFFASEIKAIFAGAPDLTRAFDPAGIDETFTFWTSVPPQAVFRGIEELRPAHVRHYANGKQGERRFWAPAYPGSPNAPRFRGSLKDAVVAVRDALETATKLRMLRADVPVGSYLSGGLDSSLVAALGREYAGDRFHTFSIRFADDEYDETSFQRLMVERLGSEHHEIVVDQGDIARAFPDVIRHTERPILRTAPAPLFLLSKLVQSQGIKVVLTGEGADEMFAGYDLFREGKVRRFWARHPESESRPRLLERLYPYLARSPVAQRAMARQFFGRNLAHADAPGFAHDTRWQTTSALKRLFSPQLRAELGDRDARQTLLATLPPEFEAWDHLARDQYLEIRTLLSGYLLSSQGDRMLMAHGIEGRFPFLDREVVALADSLPSTYKLHVLDEKHVLKLASRDLVAPGIVARQKQPYRAPDAAAFAGKGRPDYVDELLSDAAVKDAGLFELNAVSQLRKKLDRDMSGRQFSNADNMAFVGILSCQLLHHTYLRSGVDNWPKLKLSTDVDLAPGAP